jgi:head-tail adaptor
MSNKAPINSLEEIAARKQQLRAKIELQERKLSKDLDEYQDDVETFKKVWSGIKGVRHIGQNFSASGIAQAVQTVRSLPIGKNKVKPAGKASRLLTAFTLGAEVVSWIIHRRKQRKK